MGTDHPVGKDHTKEDNKLNEERGKRFAHRRHHDVADAFDALVPMIEECARGPKRPLTLFVVNRSSRKIEHFLPDPSVTGRLSAVLLGRDARCDVCIDQDPELSKRHALLVFRTFGYDGACRVFDLGSKTGVLGLDREPMNGERILPPFALLLGNAVVFGFSACSKVELISDFWSIRWNRRPERRSYSTSPWDERPMGMLAARGRQTTASAQLTSETLDRGVIVGSTSDSPVSRAFGGDESTVSDKHALLFRHEDRIQVVDLRSECGTSYADCPIAVPLSLPDVEPSRLGLGNKAYATWTPLGQGTRR